MTSSTTIKNVIISMCICEKCGNKFEGQRYNANRFCSYSCYHESRWPKETRKFIKINGVWYKGKCFSCSKPIKGQYAKHCWGCRSFKPSSSFRHNKPHTEKSKAKMSENRKGKGLHPGVNFSGQSGETHHNWKGGISPKNMLIRNSFKYKQWRKAVFERDDYTCQLCGVRGGVTLNADHIKPFSTYPELRFNLSNGRTLCKSCHLRTPTHGRKATYAK